MSRSIAVPFAAKANAMEPLRLITPDRKLVTVSAHPSPTAGLFAHSIGFPKLAANYLRISLTAHRSHLFSFFLTHATDANDKTGNLSAFGIRPVRDDWGEYSGRLVYEAVLTGGNADVHEDSELLPAGFSTSAKWVDSVTPSLDASGGGIQLASEAGDIASDIAEITVMDSMGFSDLIIVLSTGAGATRCAGLNGVSCPV